MLLSAFTKIQSMYLAGRARLHDACVEWAGSERGGVAAEYALLISLIAIALVAGAFFLGSVINSRLNQTGSCISTAPAAGC